MGTPMPRSKLTSLALWSFRFRLSRMMESARAAENSVVRSSVPRMRTLSTSPPEAVSPWGSGEGSRSFSPEISTLISSSWGISSGRAGLSMLPSL